MVIDACMELRMNWAHFFPHHVQEFFEWRWQLYKYRNYHVVFGLTKKTCFLKTKKIIIFDIWHHGTDRLAATMGLWPGLRAPRGGCLCSLCSVRRLDPSSCDILSHGCCYREWADQAEETGTGAAFRPTLDQPTEEEPQQEQGALQWEPGRHLL